MSKLFTGIAIFVVLVGIISTGFILGQKSSPAQVAVGGSGYDSTSYAFASSTAYTIGTNTSTRVAATSSARAYLIIQNRSSFPIYLGLSDVVRTANTGILVNASSTYEIRDYNLFIGSIQAVGIDTTASTTVLVTELRF